MRFEFVGEDVTRVESCRRAVLSLCQYVKSAYRISLKKEITIALQLSDEKQRDIGASIAKLVYNDSMFLNSFPLIPYIPPSLRQFQDSFLYKSDSIITSVRFDICLYLELLPLYSSLSWL